MGAVAKSLIPILVLSFRCATATFLDSLISNADIYYQSATNNGSPIELRIGDVAELTSKSNIKVIVHGFIGSRTHESIRPLGIAYLVNGYDNVLLCDWEDAAGLMYTTSRHAVGPVGQHFGKLLSYFINKHGINYADVHVIGHSLGAHIAGNIGAYFNGRLGRVTGLDPALPLFTPHSHDSLHRNAAQFVDVIHSDFPVFGDNHPRGTADFYPNFGYTGQPGCAKGLAWATNIIFNKYSCSHNRAVLLYAESISFPLNFPARPCNRKYITVQNAMGCRLSTGATVYMGEAVARTASGSYYLSTFGTPPYGMGANYTF